MPVYTATESWSAQIAVQSGDIIQNRGQSIVRVCPVTPAVDADALDIESKKAIKVTAATNIHLRSLSGDAQVIIVRGL